MTAYDLNFAPKGHFIVAHGNAMGLFGILIVP